MLQTQQEIVFEKQQEKHRLEREKAHEELNKQKVNVKNKHEPGIAVKNNTTKDHEVTDLSKWYRE